MKSMRMQWAACAFACVWIAILPANLAAQTPPASSAASAASAIDESRWGMYSRLIGQSMKDVDPKGPRLHWRWETPGQVLLEEWFGNDPTKPSYVMTLRPGSEPGTLNLKSSAMMGKEWVGTLQPDGSIDFVGKGLLKMRYTVRVDDKGDYVQTDTRGNTYRYAVMTVPSAIVAATETSTPPAETPAPARMSTPVATTAPTAPVPAPP